MSQGKASGIADKISQDGLPFMDSGPGGQMPAATNNPTPPPGSLNLNTSPYARILNGTPPGLRPFGIRGLQAPSPIAPQAQRPQPYMGISQRAQGTQGRVHHSLGQVQHGVGGAISSPITIGPPGNTPGPEFNPPGPVPVMPTEQLPGAPLPMENPNSGQQPVGNAPIAPVMPIQSGDPTMGITQPIEPGNPNLVPAPQPAQSGEQIVAQHGPGGLNSLIDPATGLPYDQQNMIEQPVVPQ